MHRLIQFLDSDHGMALCGWLILAGTFVGLGFGYGRW